jgi:hypothetical protein
VQIHQPDGGGQLLEEGPFGGGEDEVNPEPALGDALGQVDDHPLGAAAAERRQKEGDRPWR